MMAQVRKAYENELAKTGEDIPFPGWDALEAERRQEAPKIVLTIKDEEGNIVNKVSGKNKQGINRVSWNLRYASKDGIRLSQGSREGSFGPRGLIATPGTYTVTLSKVVDGQIINLTEPKPFRVKPLRKGALPGASPEEIIAFRQELQQFQQDITATSTTLNKSMDMVKAMYTALGRLNEDNQDLMTRLYEAKEQLLDLDMSLNGNRTKGEIGERSAPTPRSRMSVGMRAVNSTYGPSKMHMETVAVGKKELAAIKEPLKEVVDQVLPAIEADLMKAGAPWIEGQGISED